MCRVRGLFDLATTRAQIHRWIVGLNTLVHTNSGFTITDAVGINDSGEILCNATNAGGYEHAILLTPN
jgi:hypothetical protein